jgi:serine/threonine protein kinase
MSIQKAPTSRKIDLPYTLHREFAVLEAFQGSSAHAHLFLGRLLNLPGLIGELMIAGEIDPNVFQVDLKFTLGQPVADPGKQQEIRERAEILWTEFKALSSSPPAQAAKTRERYARILDARLTANPMVDVKVAVRQGGEGGGDVPRILAEDKALRRLNHRNIVRRYGRAKDPAMGPALFLEHVSGKTLDRIWRRRLERRQGPLPLSAVAHIAYQTAHALSYAHGQGVVHGELNPSTILIEDDSPDGKQKGVVKLVGFGAGGSSGALALAFSAPEQIRDKSCNAATDVYQLGATLFTLVTGRMPFEGESPEEVKVSLLSPEPHAGRVHHFRSDIAPRFEALIEGAREKDPAARWALPKLLEEITQLYASKVFSLQDAPKGSIVEELLVRVQTDLAMKDYFRALEALDLSRDFLDGAAGERGAEVRRKHEALLKMAEPYREAVEAVRRIQRQHIGPVDHLMEELYQRYGKGDPILTEEDKGVMEDRGDGDVVIVKRSVIDGILAHTAAAIQELAGIPADFVGDMHRKMVDRASSQEEACSDLAKKMIRFGEDYIRLEPSGR